MSSPAIAVPADVRTGSGRLVVLYDRDCGLCTATAKRLRRWDRAARLEVVPLQDATSAARPGLADLVRDLPLSATLHVVDEGSGAVRAGGDAALAIAGALPGGGLVRLFAVLPPVRWSVSLLYRLVARYRHGIGRRLGVEGPVCDVPQ